MEKFNAESRRELYKSGQVFLSGRKFNSVKNQANRCDRRIKVIPKDGGCLLVLTEKGFESIKGRILEIARSLNPGESAPVPDDLISTKNEQVIRNSLSRSGMNDCIISKWMIIKLDPSVPHRSSAGFVYYQGEKLGRMKCDEYQKFLSSI